MAGFAAAIPGIIGGVSQIFAGRGASKAAGAASNTMTGAYQDARDMFRQGMDTGNAYLQDASQNAIKWAGDAANYAGGQAVDQARASAADVSGRAAAAGQGVLGAAGQANQMLDPYAQAGQGALGQISGLANQKFQFGQDDPSYQWRLQQGQQALERSQAARGGSMGGAAAKAMARYGQGAASTEYQAAFDRFQQNRAQQLGALGGLAQMGYGAAGQSGQNLIGANQYAGNVGLQAGEYGGNLQNQATQYAGNLGVNAAQYGGNVGLQTAQDLANQERWGYQNMANMTLGRGESLASGILGQQAGKNQMWSGLGTALGAAAGGFGGTPYTGAPVGIQPNWQFGGGMSGYNPSQLPSGPFALPSGIP